MWVALTLAGLVASQLPGLPVPETGNPDKKPRPASKAVVRGPCATPQKALSIWLSSLQPDEYNEERAATCAARPAGMSETELRLEMVRLKKILDARGIYVRVDTFSEDPDYTDPSTGLNRVQLASVLPKLYLVRLNNQWMLSESSLRSVETLYHETFPIEFGAWVKSWPSWTRVPIFGVAFWQLVGFLLLMGVGRVAHALVTKILATQIRKIFTRFRVKWTTELIQTSTSPLGTLAWVGVMTLGLPSLALQLSLASVLLLCCRTIAAVAVVMVVYRAVDLLSAYLAHRAALSETKLDDQLVPLVQRGLKTVTVVMGIIFILQNLDVSVGSLLATVGVGSLAFALAAKDTVSNLFGSITIFLDRPFQIGDWVVTSGVEGTVEDVGFRSTRIRTFYNSLVSIPNGKFTDAVIDNYGLRKFRRTSTTVSLTYDTTPEQMEAFCDGVRAIIAAHPKTRKDMYEIHFSGYGDSGLNVMLYFFFEVGTWSDELRSRHEVYLDIWRLAKKLKVEFAFPTRTLHMVSQNESVPPGARPLPEVDELHQIVHGFGPGGDHVVPTGQRVHPGFYPKS